MKTLNRPNVLILYTDQQRTDSLGCYGNPIAISPNLDRLADEGVLFENYFVQSPVCTPSRMSFLTGRYPTSVGVGCNGPIFPEDRLMPVNKLLSPYGYHTAQIGKLHFDPHSRRMHENPTSNYGFDTFILSDEPGCYDDAYTKWVEVVNPEMIDKVRTALPPAALDYGHVKYSTVPRNTHEPYAFEGGEQYTHTSFVASEMCSYLKSKSDDRFFAIAGFYAPHTPVNPPQRFVDMFDIDTMPLPKIGCEDDKADYLKDIDDYGWKKIYAYYMALCAHVDDAIGSIIDTLKQTGQYDNTIIIFTTDHGEFLGDHGRIQKGMPGNDEIIRVPMIIRYPEYIDGGQIIDDMVEGVDIVPTILDYCGIQVPDYIQGTSLKQLLSGNGTWDKDDILCELFAPNSNKQVTVRTKDYMYHLTADKKELLYDIKNDPNQFENKIFDYKYKDALSEMRLRLALRLIKSADNNADRPANY